MMETIPINFKHLITYLAESNEPSINLWLKKSLPLNFPHTVIEKSLLHINESNYIQKWLNVIGITDIHGSKHHCFENFLPKLAMLGFTPDDYDFQERCQFWIDKIPIYHPVSQDFWSFKPLEMSILTGILSYCGWCHIQRVRDYILHRINTLDAAITQNKIDLTDFYLEPNDYTNLPKSRQYYVINPKFYNHGNFLLPWVYDLIGMVGMQNYLLSDYSTLDKKQILTKINRILQFILTPHYQNLTDGFGVVMTRCNYGYSLGWNIKLPGYFKFDFHQFSTLEKKRILFYLNLLKNFPLMRQTEWFRTAMNYLESFRTENGLFLFPGDFLLETKSGYWVNGAYPSMGENHKNPHWRKILSTFWILSLHSYEFSDNIFN